MNANEYASSFQFLGSRIIEFSIKNSYYNFNFDSSANKTIKFDKNIVDISEKEKGLFGIVNIYINVLISDNKEENDSQNEQCDIKLLMEGCFKAPAEMTEEEFKEMIETSGAASLYSIARGFIISTTAQSSLGGQVIIPLLNFFEIPKSDAEE